MKLLGLDSSAVAASCAVVDIGVGIKILAQASVNVKQTHSQTLMPLCESVLKAAGLSLADIDAFAVSNGPGSFTGLRISVSAVKGMAFATNKPVCGVSTLLSLGYNLTGSDCIACAVMDARRGEVYNALFAVNGGAVTRLCPDRAIALTDLEAELSQSYKDKKIVLAGDGATLANEHFDLKYATAPEHVRWQSAVGVCRAAVGKQFISAKELMPIYIRKPQAEREREEKENKTT
jgi:tRNA threonylcarbamoyladenosine biosynthesis protein TsaB